MTAGRFAALSDLARERWHLDRARAPSDRAVRRAADSEALGRTALAVVADLLRVQMAREPSTFVLACCILAELDREGFSVTREGAA